VRREALPLVGFAAATAALDAVLWWYGPSRLPGLLLALPAGLAIVAAAALAVPRGPATIRSVPDFSFPTAVLALGCVIAAAGVVFGLWLALIGAGVAIAALLGIAREIRTGAETRR
jgi:hypothetical protein